MNKQEIGNEIIKVGSHFVNLFEIKDNAAWRSILDPNSGKEESALLEAEMKKSGWQPGWPYCMAFSETIWRLAYSNLNAPSEVLSNFGKKLNPSVMTSYNACKGLITKDPIPGSIFFMQKGSTSNGHAGIVVACDGKSMATLEANTSPGKAISAEADRNGDGIYRKIRSFDFTKSSGLHLLGFLNPIEW